MNDGTKPVDPDQGAPVTPCELTTEEGFRVFYERMHPAVFRMCHFQTGHVETARDLCQEVFARAYQARGSLRQAAGVRAWVLRIALNTCRSHGRRRQLAAFLKSLLPWTGGACSAVADPKPGPETVVEERERERLVRSAIAALPPRERDALGLVALEGLSCEGAAAVLECSAQVVRQGVCRARRRLRQTLGERDEISDGLAVPERGVS